MPIADYPQTFKAVALSPSGQQLVHVSASGSVTAKIFPLANAGPDQTLPDTNNDGTELVTLDGAASSDPDGTITGYEWRENGSVIATGVNPQVTLGVGVHPLTLVVTDNDGLTDTDEVVVTVEEVTTSNPQ